MYLRNRVKCNILFSTYNFVGFRRRRGESDIGVSKLNRSLAASVCLYHKIRKLTADECAKELGVSKTTLLNIEQNNANPTLDTVSLMADKMGFDPLSLLGDNTRSEMFAAMLVMNLLENKNPNTLDTVQKAIQHVQIALDLLTQLNNGDEGCSADPSAE